MVQMIGWRVGVLCSELTLKSDKAKVARFMCLFLLGHVRG